MSYYLTSFEKSFLLFQYGVAPFALNIANVLFIVYSFDPLQNISSATNIFFIVMIIVYYFEGPLTVYMYNKSVNGWHRRLLDEKFVIFLICFFHPFYYLATLPITMKCFIHTIGTPKNMWNRLFICGDCSISSIHIIQANGMNCVSSKFFTIGIPFAIFFLLYSISMIIATPIIWILWSTFGFGPIGVAIHLSIRDELGFWDSLWYSISLAQPWTIPTFSLSAALPSIIVSVVYIAVLGTTNAWFAILLFAVGVLAFLSAAPAIFRACREGPIVDARKRRQPQIPPTQTNNNVEQSSTAASEADSDQKQNSKSET